MYPDLTGMPEIKVALKERRQEYGEVYTYIFDAPQPIPFVPGNYAHMRVFGLPEGQRAVREFSFASAPHESEFWFGVDSSSGSAFQAKLKSLQKGEEVGLFKIKGHMSWPPEDVSDVVMIAGGIGITPFRSMLRDAKHRQLPIAASVLHVHTGPILYETDMRDSSAAYQAIARVDFENTLLKIAQEHPDAHYYIAGSLGFVSTAGSMLRETSITKIQSDEFKGLPDEGV